MSEELKARTLKVEDLSQLLATEVASMDIPEFSDHIIRVGG